MKYKAIVILGSIALLTSCKAAKNNNDQPTQSTTENVAAQGETTPFIVAQNYFVKNDVENKALALKIADKVEFERYFGMAAVMSEKGKPTPIDFSKQYVVAVIEPITDIETQLATKSLVKKGDTLTLTYSIEKGAKQTFQIRPFTMVVVAKEYDADKISFVVQ